MISSPHDRLVKKVLSDPEHAAGELRAVLPVELSARIDWATLVLEPGSFVDDEAREWHTDLVFAAQIDGRESVIYLLLEHRSTVDPWMPLQLLIYLCRIWTRVRERGAARLPVLLPIVLHHGERGWTGPRRLVEIIDADEDLLRLVGRFLPDFEFLIDDLVKVSELDILRRSMTPIAKLVLWVLRAVRVGHDPSAFGAWLEELEKAWSAAPGTEALELFFVYLSEVDGGAPLANAIIDADVAADVREVAMGLRRQWEDEARAAGVAQGRVEGGAEVLLKQLRLKLGQVDASVEARVRAASIEELEAWAGRILELDIVEAILAPPD